MKPLNVGSLRSSATADADADADTDTDADADAGAEGASDDAEPFTRAYMSDDDAYQSGYGGEELHGDLPQVVSDNSVEEEESHGEVGEGGGRGRGEGEGNVGGGADGRQAPSNPSPALPPSPTPALPRDGIPRIPQETRRRLDDRYLSSSRLLKF